MGARLPPTDRPRRGGIKCEFCGRNVPSIQALRSHQNALHAKALKDKAKTKPTILKRLVKVKPKPAQKVNDQKVAETSASKTSTAKSNLEEKRTKIVKKTVEKSSTVKGKAKLVPGTEKVTEKVEEKISKPDKVNKTKAMDTKKEQATEFQCPKCDKRFPVAFSAQRHIQKHHNDEKGSGNAVESIKPIQLDYCIFCDGKFPSPHMCPNRPKPGLGLWYECVGCQQRFQNNKCFDIHVADIHSDGNESMYFPSKQEFDVWKEQMQSQTKCTFTIMGRYNTKDIYRCCNLASDTSDDVAQFCPATIICAVYPKGFQVNFYPTHYEHEHEKYTLSDQYKLYSLNDLIQQAGGETNATNSDDNDLYLQFKTLMDSIVFDAAKINIDTLKVLVGKALEMTSILTQYDEDEDVLTTVNTSTLICTPPSKKEDGITKALAGLRSSKRGIQENGFESKKKRNTFSLADDKDSVNILKELDTDNKTKLKSENAENKKINLKKATQSPSFVDSYKEFVDNTVLRETRVKRQRNVVKTKIGQFKPSLSPKKRNSAGNAAEMEYEVKERENDCNILILKI